MIATTVVLSLLLCLLVPVEGSIGTPPFNGTTMMQMGFAYTQATSINEFGGTLILPIPQNSSSPSIFAFTLQLDSVTVEETLWVIIQLAEARTHYTLILAARYNGRMYVSPNTLNANFGSLINSTLEWDYRAKSWDLSASNQNNSQSISFNINTSLTLSQGSVAMWVQPDCNSLPSSGKISFNNVTRSCATFGCTEWRESTQNMCGAAFSGEGSSVTVYYKPESKAKVTE